MTSQRAATDASECSPNPWWATVPPPRQGGSAFSSGLCAKHPLLPGPHPLRYQPGGNQQTAVIIYKNIQEAKIYCLAKVVTSSWSFLPSRCHLLRKKTSPRLEQWPTPQVYLLRAPHCIPWGKPRDWGTAEGEPIVEIELLRQVEQLPVMKGIQGPWQQNFMMLVEMHILRPHAKLIYENLRGQTPAPTVPANWKSRVCSQASSHALTQLDSDEP